MYKLNAFASIQFPTAQGVSVARGFVEAGLLPALVACYELSIPLLAHELGVSVGKPPSATVKPRGSSMVDDEDADDSTATKRQRDPVLVTARRQILELVHNIVMTAYITPLTGTDAKVLTPEHEGLVNSFHAWFTTDIPALRTNKEFGGGALHTTRVKRIRFGCLIRHWDRKYHMYATLTAIKPTVCRSVCCCVVSSFRHAICSDLRGLNVCFCCSVDFGCWFRNGQTEGDNEPVPYSPASAEIW